MSQVGVVWSGQVGNRRELLDVVNRYGERNSVYVDLTDMGLCYIDWAEELIEMFGRGEFDAHPLTSIAEDTFPTLVVVTGLVS